MKTIVLMHKETGDVFTINFRSKPYSNELFMISDEADNIGNVMVQLFLTISGDLSQFEILGEL